MLPQARDLVDALLDSVVFPHFLSGPLTLRQRLEFLRYHIEHYRPQVENIKTHPNFP